MTVKELIDILEKCDLDSEVLVNGNENSKVRVSEETVYESLGDTAKHVIVWE